MRSYNGLKSIALGIALSGVGTIMVGYGIVRTVIDVKDRGK